MGPLERYRRDGLSFDVRDTGPPDGRAVVLLHGFPQDGTAYDDVVPRLADAGLRCLVPDQRGYSPGARPAGRRAYALREIVADVEALLDAADVERAHVVGHDWGAVVGWAFAARRPTRTTGLTALSVPHPRAMARALVRSAQALRSSYMLAFQVPGLPEQLLLARDGARMRSLLRRSGLPAPYAERYARRMLEPAALSSALAWYRALPFGDVVRIPPVAVPTVFLHGRRDAVVTAAAAAAVGDRVTGPYRAVSLDAGHWLPERHPGVVAEAVLSATHP